MWTSIRGGLLAVCCLGVMSHSLAGDDRDQNRSMKGVFRGNHTGNCMESQGGFTPNLQFQLNGFAGKYSEIWVSTLVFPGDGTVTETYQGTTYFQGDPYFPDALGAGTFVGTCRHTINMNANKSFTIKGSCRSTLPQGPAAGQEAVVEGIVVHGQFSEDYNSFILGSLEPNAQTLTLSSGYVAPRLCGQTGNFIRVK